MLLDGWNGLAPFGMDNVVTGGGTGAVKAGVEKFGGGINTG